MNDISTTVAKLVINEGTLFAKINWKSKENELFNITIFFGEEVWSGSLTYDRAKQYMDYADETAEEYYLNVRKALVKNNSMFTYDLLDRHTGENATFKWMKKFEGTTATSVHGVVKVTKETAEFKDTLIDFLLDENNKLQLTLEDHKSKIEQLKKDLCDCKKELESFVNIKVSVEENLYGKFIQVLNEKKRRIQLLEKILHKHKETMKT